MTFNLKTAKQITKQIIIDNPTLHGYQLEPIIRQKLYDTFDTVHMLYHKTNLLRLIVRTKRELK